MKRAVVAAAIAAVATGCGKSSSDESKQSEPTMIDAQRPAPATDAPAAPPPPAFEAQPVQPGHAIDSKFVGWTSDGTRFVTDIGYGAVSRGTALSRHLVLRQVHDASTGAMIDSYRMSEHAPTPSKLPELAKLWEQAKPKPDWDAFAASHELANTAGSMDSPDGRYKVAVVLSKDGMAANDSVMTSMQSSELHVEWAMERSSSAKVNRNPPTLVFRLVDGDAVRNIFTHRMFHGLGTDDDATLEGVATNQVARERINVFWSPMRNRMVIEVNFDLANPRPHSSPPRAEFYVRSL
jgi:hypothetical protein